MPSLPARVAVGLLLASMLAAPADAGGDPFAAARAAKQKIDYQAALAEVDRVLEAGDLPLKHSREALALRAEFLAVLGRTPEAVAGYLEILAVDPGYRVDPGLAPRVQEAMAEALAKEPRPIDVSCRIDGSGILHATLAPGASTRARYVRIERQSPGSAVPDRQRVSPPVRIRLTSRTRIACFAVDERGNVLAAGPGWDRAVAWEPQSEQSPQSAVSGGGGASERSTSRPLWRHPWLWGSAALAAGAGGGVFAWLAERDRDHLERLIDSDDEHQYAEAEAALERGRSRVRWSRGLLGVAGLFAAAAITFALLPDPPNDRGTSASLSAGPSGLWVTGRF